MIPLFGKLIMAIMDSHEYFDRTSRKYTLSFPGLSECLMSLWCASPNVHTLIFPASVLRSAHSKRILRYTRPFLKETFLPPPQVYFDNRTLFANVTSNRPNFNVSRLDAGTSYQIKVYVSHGPVTSQPVVVSAYTSRTSRTAPGDTSTSEGGVSVGGVVGGLAVTLVLLVGVVVLRNYCRRRRGRRKQEPRPQSDDSNPDVVPNIEETYDLLAPGEPKAEASYDSMNTQMPEDVPMEAYHPLVLQSSSTHEGEEFQGSRTDRVYCPVDQLMQAEESVV
ncbi:uncharacterized protein [Penaeus vannamei]|uniref:uncharacterized protein n=1 Tax=Penaeus vannamei TaxID=6689 RepID=UPI00387F7997